MNKNILIKMMELYEEKGICKITNKAFLADRILEVINEPEKKNVGGIGGASSGTPGNENPLEVEYVPEGQPKTIQEITANPRCGIADTDDIWILAKKVNEIIRIVNRLST